MEVKQCNHLKEGIGIDKEFVKARMKENESKFLCLGKFFSKKGSRNEKISDIDEMMIKFSSTIFSMIKGKVRKI